MHWLDVKHRCETGHMNTKPVDGTPSSWPCLLSCMCISAHSHRLSITAVHFRLYRSLRKEEKKREEARFYCSLVVIFTFILYRNSPLNDETIALHLII